MNKEDKKFFNQSECGQREKQIPPTNQEAATEEAPSCTQKVPKETNTPTDQNVRAAEIHSSGRPRRGEQARGPDRTKNHRPVLPVIILIPAIFFGHFPDFIKLSWSPENNAGQCCLQ